MKKKTKSMDKLSNQMLTHAAKRSSDLAFDYFTYLSDFAKLHDIDEVEFIFHNVISFPSAAASYLLLKHGAVFSAEEYWDALSNAYNLSDGKGKHYFIKQLNDYLNDKE